MSTKNFEIKILRPYLEKLQQPRFFSFKVTLDDGSVFHLSYPQNLTFQNFMVQAANKYLRVI